jgi:hypothetical protein
MTWPIKINSKVYAKKQTHNFGHGRLVILAYTNSTLVITNDYY